MNMNFLAKIPRKVLILAVSIVFLALAFFVFRFITIKASNVPKSFLESRIDASRIAEEIVVMSKQGTDNLTQIANYDKEKKYSEALLLISQEIERNRTIREKAVSLSGKLETMTKAIPEITPTNSGQIVLEAITSETSLISRLINYNDYLMQLLENLHNKFVGKKTDVNVDELVSKINNESQAINDLNQKFNDLMDKFDKSL